MLKILLPVILLFAIGVFVVAGLDNQTVEGDETGVLFEEDMLLLDSSYSKECIDSIVAMYEDEGAEVNNIAEIKTNEKEVIRIIFDFPKILFNIDKVNSNVDKVLQSPLCSLGL